MCGGFTKIAIVGPVGRGEGVGKDMSAKKWLSLLSGLFLGFGVVGMILFDDENEPGGRLPAYI